MKTVIIPNDYHPFVIEVNGVKYTYPEGTEQSVPDEVASAIENYYKLQPKERPADGGVLPWVSKENDGDVLKVEDGVWKPGEGSGGGLKKADLFFAAPNRLDGIIADGEVEYLPVQSLPNNEVHTISNKNAYATSAPKFYGRASTASAASVEARYAKEPLRYTLTEESILALLSTGEASETVTIQIGAPSNLWDSIIVSMGSQELLCRRVTAPGGNPGTYQGFLNVNASSTMQAGLYAAVVDITRTNNNYVFHFNFFPVSTGSGDSDIYTMHVIYDDDALTVSVTETALDIANAMLSGKLVMMSYDRRGEDTFEGTVIPQSYYADGIYGGEAGEIYIHFSDPGAGRNATIAYHGGDTRTWEYI